jgi:hypothetical protein
LLDAWLAWSLFAATDVRECWCPEALVGAALDTVRSPQAGGGCAGVRSVTCDKMRDAFR